MYMKGGEGLVGFPNCHEIPEAVGLGNLTRNGHAKGRHKKKNCFFSEKLRKEGGGLAESKISLSEKTEIFLDFFFKRGGVSPIPKGCYHKNQEFLDICAKKGGLTQSIGILS